MPNVRNCTHIKVTGVRCGSPAMRGEQFCYFHQRMMRGVATPPQARLHPIAILENEEAIQASLMEVINALIRNTIDFKRAELILRALHIAVRNARRVRFGMDKDEMVREVPNYPAQPKPAHPASPAPEPTVTAATIQTASPSQTASNPVDPIQTVDPIQRKPSARAGLPAERAKVAASMRAPKGSS